MKGFIAAVLAIGSLVAQAAPVAEDFSALTARDVEIRADAFVPRDDNNADGFNDSDGKSCLTAARAQQVATNFRNLIVSYSNTLANQTLTTNFVDHSDSVNELINHGCSKGPAPLGTPTFTSRAQFEAGQGGQPSVPFKQLLIWHTCHAVIIRWESQQSPDLVTGIIVMETTPAPAGNKYPDLIQTVYSEFNSGAWLHNLGDFNATGCSK